MQFQRLGKKYVDLNGYNASSSVFIGVVLRVVVRRRFGAVSLFAFAVDAGSAACLSS